MNTGHYHWVSGGRLGAAAVPSTVNSHGDRLYSRVLLPTTAHGTRLLRPPRAPVPDLGSGTAPVAISSTQCIQVV